MPLSVPLTVSLSSTQSDHILVQPQMEWYRVTAVARGVMEIKCPYCHKSQSIEVSTQDTKFCIQKNADGVLALEHSHANYYQMQTQLFVCNADYCDFCVCKMKSMIFTQRTYNEKC